MPAFFGRNDQLSLLHDWIDGNDKGLCSYLCAIWRGKSALLARLCCDHRSRSRHAYPAFCVLADAFTTSPASALSHLLASLNQEIDRVDPDDREMRIPAEEAV